MSLYRFYVVLLYIPQVAPYIFCGIPHADQQLHVSLYLLVVLLIRLSELEVYHYDFFTTHHHTVRAACPQFAVFLPDDVAFIEQPPRPPNTSP